MGMYENFLKFIFVLSLCSLVRCQTACPFNTKCTCDSVSVNCDWDSPTFPVFTTYNSTNISQIIISVVYTGNATLTIPPNAFFALQSLQKPSYVYFNGNYTSCNEAPKIVISPGAFNTYQNISFYVLEFSALYIPELTANTFDKIQINYILSFFTTCIDSIDDNAFSGLNTNYIQMYKNGVKMARMAPSALAGINFTGTGTELEFSSAGLSDLKPFKIVTVSQLYVDYNTFVNISDFAFCSCNILGQCNNTVLKSIYLDNNNIQYISPQAFANLVNLASIDLSNNAIQTVTFTAMSVLDLNLDNNQLIDFSASQLTGVITLSLAGNLLTTVPTDGIQSFAASLSSLVLSSNNITTISSNSFYGCVNLNHIYLSNNPISTIEPGAFNGISSISTFVLSNMTQLNTVDLLIAYGMNNLELMGFVYDDLETLYVSDVSKLPSGLTTIIFSGISTLKQIDPSLENWLKLSPTNLYSFSYNTQFPCNDAIQWMAPYALCSPTQITINPTTCEDGTSALSYLQSFQPVC